MPAKSIRPVEFESADVLCVDADVSHSSARETVAGWVVRLAGRRVADGAIHLPRKHPLYPLVRSGSTAAELWALSVAAEKAGALLGNRKALAPARIVFFSDNQSAVLLLQGEAKTKTVFRPLLAMVLAACEGLPPFSFAWIERRLNTSADSLARTDRPTRIPGMRRPPAALRAPLPLRAPLGAWFSGLKEGA